MMAKVDAESLPMNNNHQPKKKMLILKFLSNNDKSRQLQLTVHLWRTIRGRWMWLPSTGSTAKMKPIYLSEAEERYKEKGNHQAIC